VSRQPSRPAPRRPLLYTLGPPLIVSLVVVLVGGGYWAVKIRDRADAAAIQRSVAGDYPGAHVTCSGLSSNGATWVCAVVYRAESECVAAKVSVTGAISSKLGHDRCKSVPQLTALVPDPTPAAVAADVARLGSSGGPALVCARVPSTKTRWACLPQHQPTGTCSVLRVVPWLPWKVHTTSRICAQIPALRQAAA
jgi:hypothetical protein